MFCIKTFFGVMRGGVFERKLNLVCLTYRILEEPWISAEETVFVQLLPKRKKSRKKKHNYRPYLLEEMWLCLPLVGPSVSLMVFCGRARLHDYIFWITVLCSDDKWFKTGLFFNAFSGIWQHLLILIFIKKKNIHTNHSVLSIFCGSAQKQKKKQTPRFIPVRTEWTQAIHPSNQPIKIRLGNILVFQRRAMKKPVTFPRWGHSPNKIHCL